ncbi:MAG: hypothetical protein ACRDVL_12545 [Acidimicrobiia bacterium]
MEKSPAGLAVMTVLVWVALRRRHQCSVAGMRRVRWRLLGVLGTDLWALGAWWGEKVGRGWDQTVVASFETIKTESERRDPSSSNSG